MKYSIEKIRRCLALLPPPGGEVVAECLDEIELLRQQLAAKQAKVDELREHVLCDKEPAAWLQISVDDPSLATLVRMKKPVKFDPSWWRFEPLYKAKEPEQ